MNEVEIRVRPVVRYVVTRYAQESMGNGPDGKVRYAARSETLGEFDSERYANEVADTMRPRERVFAVVERSLTPECRVFYAYDPGEAAGMATALSEKYGVEFRIFEADKNPSGIRAASEDQPLS